MSRLAHGSGMNVPQSIAVKNTDLFDWNRFPCIVKPINSIDGSKSDIAILKDKKSLDQYIHNSNIKGFIIQEFINKEYEFQLIGVVDYSGNIIMPAVTKLIEPTIPTTNTGVVEVDDINNYNIDTDPIQKFISSTGYRGLFSVEMLHCNDGKDYFMEMNFRNDGNTIAMLAAGINLPLLWINSCINQIERFLPPPISKSYIMPIFPFLRKVANGHIRFVKFLNFIIHSKCFMDFTFKDLTIIYHRLLNK